MTAVLFNQQLQVGDASELLSDPSFDVEALLDSVHVFIKLLARLNQIFHGRVWAWKGWKGCFFFFAAMTQKVGC